MYSGKILIIILLKGLNKSKDAIVLVQDMEVPEDSFNTKNEPKYLNKARVKFEVKKTILAARVSNYIEREMILV